MEQTDITLESSCQGKNGTVVIPEGMEKAVAKFAERLGCIEHGPERESFDDELADVVNFGPSLLMDGDTIVQVNSIDIIQ